MMIVRQFKSSLFFLSHHCEEALQLRAEAAI
jgi:hypothetical protein